jgi:hypothetical protein
LPNRMSDTLRASSSPITREAIARAMSPMSFNERIDAMIRANNFNGMQLTGNVKQGAPDWRGDLQSNISEQLGLGRAGRGRLNKVMNVGEVVSGVGGAAAGVADTAQASSPTERNLMGALTALSIIPGMGAVTKYAKPALKNALYRSRLGPAIEAMPMDKMTGQQAASHFSKFPGGVGSDELNYTGVQGLLNQPQVTKAGLLEQYRANPLEINDVIKGGDETKFGPGRGYNTTLPGGDDYQELLMTLPQQKTPAYREWEATISRMKEKYGDYNASRMNPEEAAQLTRQYRAAGDSGLNYTSGHYDEPNVLAHSRYNTRNVDGDKTLFIEEIQSDWHQTGREKGYKISKDKLGKQTNKDYSRMVELESLGPKTNQTQRNEYFALEKKYNGDSNRIIGKSGVPDAPY